MPRFYQRLAALAKIETTYGVDAVPTGIANAMLMSDVTVTPISGDKVQRDNILPYFGDQGSVIAGGFAKIEGSIEIAGSGAAGTAPAYGALLRACSLAEVITAATKVEYKPATANPEAATLYANLDGTNHALLGARGTVSLAIVPKQLPKLRFTLWGLLGPIADTALPSTTLTAFQTPLVPSKAVTTFSLHGLSAVTESLSIDLGNQVEPRMLVGSESIQITDRNVSGSAVVEAVSLATKDWIGLARAATKGALSLVHGVTAGNIVEIAAPAVQIGQPTYGNTQGILNMSLPLMFCPVTGDDEIVLRIR